MNFEIAREIAEKRVAGMANQTGIPMTVLDHFTVERDFGWTFFYAATDKTAILAGNAPIIVDRKDGSVHVTGTAYPTECYIEACARVGRTWPFAIPEQAVVLEGWRPGLLTISLMKLLRGAGMTLAEAKHATDELVAGKPTVLTLSTEAEADRLAAHASELGAIARRETRYR